jgi:hypothetical protein
VIVVTPYDSASFAAGQDSGARIAACLARLAAHELLEDSRWWNRRRRRLMADALVACAADVENAADATRIEVEAARAPVLRLRLAPDAR